MHSVVKTKRVLLLFYVARWVFVACDDCEKVHAWKSKRYIEINVTNDYNTRQKSHRNNQNWYRQRQRGSGASIVSTSVSVSARRSKQNMKDFFIVIQRFGVVVADAGVLHLAYRFMRLWYALFIQLAYNRNTNTPMTGKYCCFSLFLLCAHKYSRTHTHQANRDPCCCF